MVAFPVTLRERLWLAETMRRARSTTRADHAAVRARLALAERRASASATLWSAGERAQAIRLRAGAIEAMRPALSAASALATTLALGPRTSGEPIANDALTLDRLLLSERDKRVLRAAFAASERTYPEQDHALQPDDERAYVAMRRGYAVARRAVLDIAPTPLEVWLRRAARGAVAAIALLVIALIVVAIFFRPPSVQATASYGGRYTARAAFDGDETTEWLLPAGQEGTLEISGLSDLSIARVRIVNARNAPFLDRATREIHLSLLADGVVVAGADAELPGPHESRREVTIVVNVTGIDAVRIETRSHHGEGSGLAEVILE